MAVKNGKFHYFIVVRESLYHDSSFYEPSEYMFDEEEEALGYAKRLCEEEKTLLEDRTGLDYMEPELYRDGVESGYVVTAKDGLSDWRAYARVIELKTKV